MLLLTLSGCAAWSAPPSISSVDQRLRDNYSDIETIVEFMANSGYKDIYIDDTSGKMLSDLVLMDISDELVRAAVSQVLGSGAYKSISKQGNTIFLFQWHGSQDMGCGVAYSINPLEIPEIQFLTELVPLSTEGWYYFVDDYNKWRIETAVT